MFHMKVQSQNSIAADSMNTNADNYNNRNVNGWPNNINGDKYKKKFKRIVVYV